MTRTLALVALLGAGCPNLNIFSGSLDTPGAIGVLAPAPGRPFDAPVGYVADRTGGIVRALALVDGTYLPETPVASFLRGRHLATGHDRLLAGVAPYAADADTVDVWVIDRRWEELLRVPHYAGRDARGALVPVLPRIADVAFTAGGDRSGEAPRLEGLTSDPDAGTSERWTITFDGAAWRPVGSRSGTQRPAPPDVLWRAIDGGLTFVPRGDAVVGDTFVVEVDAGIEAVALPAVPRELVMAPDQRALALVVGADATDSAVHLVDPATGALGDALPLPEGSVPGRVAWSADSATLYVADSGRAAAWAIDATSRAVRRFDLPWPTVDVAVVDGARGPRLHVVPADATSVWVVDVPTGQLVDLNPATPAVDGRRFLGPITGLAAMPTPYAWPSYRDLDDDSEGADEEVSYGASVAVTLHAGRVVWMGADDGCLVPEPDGPRTRLLGAGTTLADYEPDFAIRVPGTAHLDLGTDGLRHVVVNPCAGIAPTETWDLTYDAAVGAWRVRGSVSGVQERLAYEEERYLSDDGEISFTMRAGVTPSTDGWRIRFNVIDGAVKGDGDNQDDRVREVELDLPGRPVAIYGRLDGEDRAWVAVPASGSDIVVRVNASSGIVDAIWE